MQISGEILFFPITAMTRDVGDYGDYGDSFDGLNGHSIDFNPGSKSAEIEHVEAATETQSRGESVR